MTESRTEMAEHKVVGVGWAKTGTTSLGEALRILGYDHQGPRLDLVEAWRRGRLGSIKRLATEKESFDDWPWILLYRQIDEWFPRSRFVLTVRQTDRWLMSHRAMTARQGSATDRLIAQRRFLYGLPFPDVTDDDLRDRFRRHNTEVRKYFAERPSDLLIVNWEEGDGWDELCEFLAVPVPDVPFPHLNRAPAD